MKPSPYQIADPAGAACESSGGRRRVRPAAKVRTFLAIKEAVLHGIGIGLLLENSLFPSSHFVTRPIVEMLETYRHCLVTPRGRDDLRLIQSFVEIAQDVAPSQLVCSVARPRGDAA